MLHLCCRFLKFLKNNNKTKGLLFQQALKKKFKQFIKMIDLSRRHFLKQTFKFSVASTAAIATFPMVNLYQEKVRPVLAKEFPEATFSSDLSFLQSITPHLIIGSSIMSFIMMYADQLEIFVTLLIAALALLVIGIPVTESVLSIFI